MKSPFGPVEITVFPDHIHFRFSDCKVNGIAFKGDISVKVPDGSDNQWTNKFRVDYSGQYLRRIFPENYHRTWKLTEDHLSDNARSKIGEWACEQAAKSFTPEAKNSAEITRETAALHSLLNKKEELIKELLRLETELIPAQNKKLADLAS